MQGRSEWLVFTEFFADVPLSILGERLHMLRLAGVDLSVRSDGSVDPLRVEDDLPRAVEMLAAHGVRVGKITTDLTDASDPLSERVLRTARDLGIRHYQTGSWLYRDFGSLKALRREVGARLRELAALNTELGIQGALQNHSCEQFGANLADLDAVLDGIAPDALGVYYDPAHAAIEGGGLGWLMNLDLVRDHVVMLGVKDFRWVNHTSRHCTGPRQSAEFCPLGEGNTPWQQVLALLVNKLAFDGPVVLFGEYRDENCFQILDADAALEQTARDAALFEQWIGAVHDAAAQDGPHD